MRSSRSKEDEVQRISTSVFVTNFPEVFSAKDLWNTCKQYGQVVDAYIPNKRSKAGKRFGFVRFVKVFDTERLVNNLCTDEDTFDDEFGKDNSKVNMNFNSEGESDKEEVQETIFSSHKVESKGRDDINDDDDVLISDDPFKIYDLLEKQKCKEGDKKFDKVDKLNGKEQGYTENANEQVNNVEEKSNKDMSSLKEEDKESRCSGHFRRVEGPKTGGSILQLLDDVVKVGQTMGYKMDGCVSNIEEIIKSRGENEFYQ
ncbi:RNA-directed DNA polymerase, eukaryota [Tanacetum coccineum]|uniref:RNA-directed DNA polymerase, eukaryota n=1 Tax=Tanacetum coccineum TaxID=301880 RepID=A0ABQ5G473_9ASTR